MFSSTLFECNVRIVLTNIQPLVAVLDASLRCLQLLIFSLSCNISTLKWRYKSLKAPRVHLALSPSLFYFISLLLFIPRSSQLNTIHGFVIQYTFPGSLCQCSALLGKVSKPPPLLLLFHSFIIWLVAHSRNPGLLCSGFLQHHRKCKKDDEANGKHGIWTLMKPSCLNRQSWRS